MTVDRAHRAGNRCQGQVIREGASRSRDGSESKCAIEHYKNVLLTALKLQKNEPKPLKTRSRAQNRAPFERSAG